MITYVNPAVAALLGVSLLGETLTVGMGVGFAFVLAGDHGNASRRTEGRVRERRSRRRSRASHR